MLYIGYLIILDGQDVKRKTVSENSIAFGKSTAHRIYPKQALRPPLVSW